jgi:hypothetical protein
MALITLFLVEAIYYDLAVPTIRMNAQHLHKVPTRKTLNRADFY